MARKRVLIVDDEREMLLLFSVRLQHEGYKVDVAFDGLGAVAKAVKFKPDIILLDIMMPAGGGVSVLELIRNNADTFGIPVIVMTANCDQWTKEAVARLGVSDYFIKPFEAGHLTQRIKEILQS